MIRFTPSKLAHVRKLRRIVVKRDLPRPPEFDACTDDELTGIYNGIGSDKFRFLLGITTAVFGVFEASALVHDHGWSPFYNDGSKKRFDQTNNRFRAGNLVLASTCGVWFGWLRPQQRAVYRAAGETLYRVVDGPIGWSVWGSSACREDEPGPEVMA